MLDPQAPVAAAANWWLDVLGASLQLNAETWTEHFLSAAVAEWELQERKRPGSWPEDQQITVTFDRRPGFFLSIVLCAALGHADLSDPSLNAKMTLAATGYRVERWLVDQNRYVLVASAGTL